MFGKSLSMCRGLSFVIELRRITMSTDVIDITRLQLRSSHGGDNRLLKRDSVTLMRVAYG
ncbi:MAG: hypothetical protein AUH69_05105 [Actinobacteria bacterium 13_1_40CM_4_65_12]|nr:MAG: hypothetical protein AUH69_05105 [Actinobacteria bacterium 13_1_40CM_4_65_12]